MNIVDNAKPFELNEDSSSKGPAERLTDWENEPKLTDLKTDLEGAKPAHDAQMTKIDNWVSAMNVTGKYAPKSLPGRSKVQPRLIRRQCEWRYSALTEPFLSSSRPFKLKGVTAEDGRKEQQNEMLLRHQFRTKIDRNKFIDQYVRATVNEGTSVVRVGWERSVIQVKETVPVYSYFQIQDMEAANAFQEALQARADDPTSFMEQAPVEIQRALDYYDETGEATVAVETGTEEVMVDKVLQNRPDLRIFDPRNAIIDPSCEGDLDRANFVIFTFETSKAELKKDGRYKNLDRVNWDSATPVTDGQHAAKPHAMQFKDALRKRVVAYEYWGFSDIDGTGNLIPFVATWIGSTLIRMEKNPYPDQKLPLVVVPYIPVTRELYGEADAELLIDNQNILGAVTRGLIDLLGRSANAQQGFAKGMLDAVNRRRFDNGLDYEFNPGNRPELGHIQHKYPDIPQSAMLMLNLQNQDAEALTGVKSFSGGLSGSAYGDVAAGVRSMLDAASKREMAILRRLAKGLADIARKIIAMNAVFLSEEEVIRVTNEEYVTIRREDIAGEFDIEVDISTAEIDNAQVQDLAFMLQTIGPNADAGIVLMILSEIARLKQLPELAERIAKFKPEPDPLQQKKLELEMELLQAQIDETRAKAQAHLAKAGESDAKTGKQAVETEERVSGIEHARELEKQQAQARGNQDLAITKALTAQQDPTKAPSDIEAAAGYRELSDRRDDAGGPGVGL